MSYWRQGRRKEAHLIEWKKTGIFLSCIEDYSMLDIGFTRTRFICCTGRGNENKIWKRLDMMHINSEWSFMFPRSEVEHLTSTGSDHTPMIFKCTYPKQPFIRYFKFL